MIVGVRHGRVENPGHVVYARLPGFHLAEDGRAAAGELAAELAAAPVAAVVSSPLDRALETAEILAAPHGLAVEIDDRLIEWGFWVGWQGLPWSRIRERDPEALDRYAADPESVGGDDRLVDAGGRVLSWAAEAERAHGGGLVLGVSHEAPLAAAMLTAAGEGLGEFHAASVPHLALVRLLPAPAGRVEAADVVAVTGPEARS